MEATGGDESLSLFPAGGEGFSSCLVGVVTFTIIVGGGGCVSGCAAGGAGGGCKSSSSFCGMKAWMTSKGAILLFFLFFLPKH